MIEQWVDEKVCRRERVDKSVAMDGWEGEWEGGGRMGGGNNRSRREVRVVKFQTKEESSRI